MCYNVDMITHNKRNTATITTFPCTQQCHMVWFILCVCFSCHLHLGHYPAMPSSTHSAVVVPAPPEEPWWSLCPLDRAAWIQPSLFWEQAFLLTRTIGGPQPSIEVQRALPLSLFCLAWNKWASILWLVLLYQGIVLSVHLLKRACFFFSSLYTPPWHKNPNPNKSGTEGQCETYFASECAPSPNSDIRCVIKAYVFVLLVLPGELCCSWHLFCVCIERTICCWCTTRAPQAQLDLASLLTHHPSIVHTHKCFPCCGISIPRRPPHTQISTIKSPAIDSF